MRHLLEILKIIEGAVQSDRSKVIAYADQLAAKLQAEGDVKAATRLKRALANSPLSELSLARHTTNERMPVDSESRLHLADEELVDLATTEIFLTPDAEETVEEFFSFIRGADRLFEEGVGISPSLLTFGPPGCGKTELARYISACLDLPLLTGRTDSLISSYLGSTAKNLRMLFEHAMARPCVLLLDEFDAVAKLRDDRHEVGELKRVVVSLLQNIDALDNKTVLIAATNHEHLLDPAIWRRFAYKVHMDFPDVEIRSQIFSKFLGRFADKKQIDVLAEAAEGLSGSDIRQLAESAIRTAVLTEKDQVITANVLRRILKFRLPEDELSVKPTEELLRKVRDLNPKVFIYQHLADIFGISVGKVSKLLRSKE